MLPDRVSNPGPLTYESGALPIALRGPETKRKNLKLHGMEPNKTQPFSCVRRLQIVHKTVVFQSCQFQISGRLHCELHSGLYLGCTGHVPCKGKLITTSCDLIYMCVD